MSQAASATSARAARALLDDREVHALLAALSADGEEARIVGGAVRDALVGRPVNDVDIATTALPEVVIRTAERMGWKSAPTGIEHGTVTVVVDGRPFEVTTLRRDVASDGRKAVVAFTRDFAEDAVRRDFTMNALSLSIDGVVHDYATGVDDARNGIVRFMGDPEARIREDYLRILRFFRFHASHGGGAPEPSALEACGALKDGMIRLSRERIRQELLKLLPAPRALDAVTDMASVGLWPHILPGRELRPDALGWIVRFEREHGAAPDAVLRLAGFCAGNAGLKRDLALSNADFERIAAAQTASQVIDGPWLSEAQLRKQLFLLGREGFRDACAVRAAWDGWSQDELDALLARSRSPAAQPPPNPFGSADVAALGIAPGPRMGIVLKAATAAWLDAGLPEDAASQADLLRRAASLPPD